MNVINALTQILLILANQILMHSILVKLQIQMEMV